MTAMRFQAPKGTQDVLPDRSVLWQWLESNFRENCRLYGYGEIRTPLFEDTELFLRGIGEGTDVVHKEMYTFTDRGGRSITLKPEGTAPAIRAFVEHSLAGSRQITRLYYITPVYRYERPQKGRLREHHQCGVELLGCASPDADAEVIDLTFRFYARLGLGGTSVLLNSLGEAECRARFRDALLSYANSWLADLPAEFRDRVEKNPLRLLDTKDDSIQERLHSAPSILDYLEPESSQHFDALQQRLTALSIPFELSPRLVRGLDYYTKTVFELQTDALGAQNSLCGGGRYDRMVEMIGGQPTPAVGVGIGMERALMLLDALGLQPEVRSVPLVFFVALASDKNHVAAVVSELRSAGISVETDPEFRSAKSQFRQADKSGATYAVVVGDDEIAGGRATIKQLETGAEAQVAFEKLVTWLTS